MIKMILDEPFYGEKSISGKLYKRYNKTYNEKDSAQAEARTLRKLGWSVRIIKEHPYEHPHGKKKYCLYIGGRLK